MLSDAETNLLNLEVMMEHTDAPSQVKTIVQKTRSRSNLLVRADSHMLLTSGAP